ncbi:P-loop containing nucleoside triphosphate hydrolase protein [Podospora fimiseda]|uniref:P-loop containing nucleoside triphosphate hydrolase protein n=1 Tax=Podospora fimiseda TaxID=252190 RepID=A0AAN7BKP9_9PEZI|nr:P-loop containing nucleoside triphosphate hydrolase protein [Podospora fimiseda]
MASLAATASEVDAQPDFELIESETPQSGFTTPKEEEVTTEAQEAEEINTVTPEDTAEDTTEEEEETPLEQDQLEFEISSMPIVHRRTYNEDKEWITNSFTVNDTHMRELLAQALKDYFPDPDQLDVQKWTFEPSFESIVHRWDKLQALHKKIKQTCDDKNRIKAVNGLIDFIEPLVKPFIEARAKIQDSRRVSWSDLWQIFPPGELVVTKMYGVESIFRVVSSRKRTSAKIYQIKVEYVEWNGSACRIKNTKVDIDNYAGSQQVRSLKLVPLSYTENPDEFREAMRARGQRFQELRGYHYLAYDGLKVCMDVPTLEPVSGRVIIDTHAYYKSINQVPGDSGTAVNGSNEEEQTDEQNADATNNASDLDAVSTPRQTTDRKEDLSPLSDEECLMTSPWLIGFDLKAKKWGRFCIDNLSDIEWNDKAFDNLVSRGGEKHLAWDFVESKAHSTQDVDDFVHDKGRGIIILMFGPPGVGKTFTAEAVAERARVPLYTVSAGVLSTKPAELESGLDHALDLCRMWNAMLLLDEADVFLSARSDEGLERNELVSIFLTKLEYYQGILFLTTNRFSSIDYAFQSRVDLFLPYYDLDAASRRQVWQNFFVHFGEDKFKGITEREMDRLCELGLNGREIKNLCKSALLLSEKGRADDKDGRIMAEKLYMLAEKRVDALRLLGHGSDDRMVGRQ